MTEIGDSGGFGHGAISHVMGEHRPELVYVTILRQRTEEITVLLTLLTLKLYKLLVYNNKRLIELVIMILVQVNKQKRVSGKIKLKKNNSILYIFNINFYWLFQKKFL